MSLMGGGWGGCDMQFSLCLEDISRVALGKYIQTLARALCQAESEGSRSQARFHSLLEKMFNLYMDYGVSWSDSAGLSLTEAGILNAPEVAESAIYRYTCKEVVFIVHMNVCSLECRVKLVGYGSL